MSHTLNKPAQIAVIAAFLSFGVSGVADSKQSVQFAIPNKPDSPAKKNIEFVLLPERHLMISSECVKSRAAKIIFECAAYRALRIASTVQLNKEHYSGGHPGAAICRTPLGGEFVIGIENTPERDENGFCRFKDGSIVDVGTIFRYALDHLTPE
ncbi:MAG: hypothetical protein A2428_09470 [Bdellovibrionales bacterium RIFOXYC1_FULL_54_43]|nr:MAG: hypothetical protein A2428_09470 [Bdellovibrionales bacterium RIFOXYC1_FULL_54_43]OFZ81433.1 MAG: hypothetical protein A2603_09320 [Bdellovibrionales bacterium RIFOXYD1_FULL_55_31]